MGCSIHAHVEVEWQNSDEADRFAHVDLNRNYILFALMANVRNHNDSLTVFEPKGLPQGLSENVRYEVEKWDGHSHSWLSLEELEIVRERYAIKEGVENVELDAVIGLMKAFKKHNYSEPRLVFWFDN